MGLFPSFPIKKGSAPVRYPMISSVRRVVIVEARASCAYRVSLRDRCHLDIVIR